MFCRERERKTSTQHSLHMDVCTSVFLPRTRNRTIHEWHAGARIDVSMSASVPFASRPPLSRTGSMATCAYPHCVACFDVVRYCPSCRASFAVCAAHQETNLRCPWPTRFGSPCLTQVPISVDQRWRVPLTNGPMYVRPFRQGTGQPPGLHFFRDTEHSAMSIAEPTDNTDLCREHGTGTGALHRQSNAKKHTASV